MMVKKFMNLLDSIIITKVFLLERDHFIGGRVPQWGTITDSEKTGEELVDQLYNELAEKENVEIITGVL